MSVKATKTTKGIRLNIEVATLLNKVFCATGPGGGVDPTCTLGGGSGVAKKLPPVSDADYDRESETLGEIMREFHNTNDKKVLEELVSYGQPGATPAMQAVREDSFSNLKFDDDGKVELYRGEGKTGEIVSRRFSKEELAVALPWEGEVIVMPGVVSDFATSFTTDPKWASRFARYANLSSNI